MAIITGYKMLLRKRGTASSILAIALLVAILASTNATVNYLNLQAENLGRLVNPSGTYIILSQGSSSIADSKISTDLLDMFINSSYIEYAIPQTVLTANLIMGAGTPTIQVRGVGGVGAFLKAREAHLNGTVAKSCTEANAGEMLARAFSIKLGDELSLAVGDERVKVKVVGIFGSRTQSDAELIVPIEIANRLTGDNGTTSLIELSLKRGADWQRVLGQIERALPENVKLIRAQQLGEFVLQLNVQTLTFLNVWSVAVYAAVVISSYVIAARVVTESSYELAMLRALGAKKRPIFILILTYTAAVAFLGSILGVALGTIGTQTASTILRWVQPSVEITPFLKVEQAFQTLLLTLVSSILGCVYPALKTARTRYMEQPL